MVKTLFKGIGNTWVKVRDRIIEFSHDDAGYFKFGSVRVYFVSTAITANVTTTSAPAGSVAFTSNSTGRGVIFQSDGTKWQVSTATVPVKATGAELDTGTDDAKFATAKALADSEYVNETAMEAYAHPLVTPATHIDDPTGAATDQDDEARAAIADILDALEAAGIVEPAA